MIRLAALWAALAVCLCACGGGEEEEDGGVNTAPSISGTPVTRIWEGDVYVFAPNATDAEGSRLTFEVSNLPPWATFDADTGRLSGVPDTGDSGTYVGVTIRVSDGELTSSLAPFDLTVEAASRGAVTLSWTPPSQNTDESLLDDLKGFNVYWGTDRYDLALYANVTGPGITSYLVDGLTPGTYYFATSARNAYGIESDLSDLVTIVVR